MYVRPPLPLFVAFVDTGCFSLFVYLLLPSKQGVRILPGSLARVGETNVSNNELTHHVDDTVAHT